MPSDAAARRSRAALEDIRANIRLAQAFVDGLDAAALGADLRAFYAVVRCLEIISEASRCLAPEVQARHPAIPWPQIAAAGNVYRHMYGDVTADLVWETVRRSLPPLLLAVEEDLTRGG